MKTTRTALALAACVALLGWAGPAAADDPEPTPTAKPAGKKTLGDVAKELRLKGGEDSDKGDSKGIVISNRDLPEYADKGKITTAKPTTGGSAVPPRPEDGDDEESKREYWRNQYIKQLRVIEDLEREVEALDKQIPKLWSDFYAWDDPAYRDGVIKPKLDEAMARREQAEKQLAEEKLKPAEIKQEARKDGALPGWFRGL
jgi:hypothetical protein